MVGRVAAAKRLSFDVSIISLYVGIHYGQTMKEMAEANARMVAASSWPFVEFQSGNVNSNGQPELSLNVANQGVGPARIERLEMRLNGQPMHTTLDLMKACCAKRSDDLHSIYDKNDFKSALITTPIERRIPPAREERPLVRLPKTANNSQLPATRSLNAGLSQRS